MGLLRVFLHCMSPLWAKSGLMHRSNSKSTERACLFNQGCQLLPVSDIMIDNDPNEA
jgi:hypothetical protein